MVRVLALLLVVEAAVVVAIWDPSDWRPLSLLLVLALCVVVAELGGVMIRGIAVSSSLLALLLAMTLLGPVPAAALGTGAALLDRTIFGKPAAVAVINVFVFSTICLAGGLAIEVLGRDIPGVVFGVGLMVLLLNFVLVAGLRRIATGESVRRAFADTFIPTVPYHVVGATLAAAAVQAHGAGRMPALAGAVLALLVSELLLRSVAASHSRADELVAVSKERADLLQASLTAEEAERAWIASRLHDETLQTLAIVEQDLAEAAGDHAAVIDVARSGLRAVMRDLRQTLAHVHPAAMEETGLEPALRAYAAQMARRGPEFRVTVDPAVGGAQDGLLYGLARELMLNAAKHASAQLVEVLVERDSDTIMLAVADDGVGFGSGSSAAVGHVGLATARRRARAAGGELSVHSVPGTGSTVVVRIPPRQSVITVTGRGFGPAGERVGQREAAAMAGPIEPRLG